jgi:hypothetical protein
MLADLAPFIRRVECELPKWIDGLTRTRQATEETAAILKQEFGTVPQTGGLEFAPRSLVTLPVIAEQEVTEQTSIDLKGLAQGRFISRGYYANLGDSAFKVVLVGANGQKTIAHTVPPSTTINITSYLAEILIFPADGQPAHFQVFGQ